MGLQQRLLRSLVRENPFQPATSWWRAAELAAVVQHGMPQGHGLDLGCGDGKLMAILHAACKATPSLVGVDIDAQETAAAAACGIYQRVHTVAADRVPEPDGTFDFVFSNSVLEHIEDIEPVVAEVARLLRPRGTFLFTVPGEQFHDCLAGPLLPWSDRGQYLGAIDRRCAHRRYWDEAQWRQCLARYGIEITHTVRYLTAAEVRRWEALSRYTAGTLFMLFGQRAQPIAIQRMLGLRRPGMRLPAPFAAMLATVISAGVRNDGSGPFACLLIEGRRRA